MFEASRFCVQAQTQVWAFLLLILPPITGTFLRIYDRERAVRGKSSLFDI